MTRQPPRRVFTRVLTGAVILAIGLGAGWAANTLLSPPHDVLALETATFTTVEQGEVSASINLMAVAEWPSLPAGTNRAAGVVTGVAVSPGQEVTTGSELYSVDLRPVVIAAGQTPAFRSISAGVEGPDVAQLQHMLASLGFYGGEADGKAGSYTASAIKAWQKSRGVEQTGIIAVDEVIFVPTLPARVSLDEHIITRGAMLSGGELAVQVLSPSPSFSIAVTDTQAAQMPAGTHVEINGGENLTWHALTAHQSTDPANAVITVALASTDSEPICRNDCGNIPVSGQTKLPVRVITESAVSGLVVPSAALLSLPRRHDRCGG